MKTPSLILVAWVAVAYCGKAKKQIHDQQQLIDDGGYDFDGYGGDDASALVGLIESNSHFLEAAPVVAIAASDHHSNHLARPGYSVGGPLASIAKGQPRR